MCAVPKRKCDYCGTTLADKDHKYHGKHYCEECFHHLFHFRTCVKCNKVRKIYDYQEPPICKSCQVKGKPCIRCGKTEYPNGKITEYGPVCNVCAKYYTEYEKCSVCKSGEMPTSYRTMPDGSVKLLCLKCHYKTMPICAACLYRRQPFSYTLGKQPLCKTCSVEGSRKCRQCGESFPAGKGSICPDCHHENTLVKKTNFIAKTLSVYTAEHFITFSKWLKKRRDIIYVSSYIQKYHAYFLEIDELAAQNGKMPSYEELLATFPHATDKTNMLVHLYLQDAGIITIDEEIKDKYANLNLIEKYLSTFSKSDRRHLVIESYYRMLLEKYKINKTSLRSIRLALTPAVKILIYSGHFKKELPDIDILSGYLWVYPGQRCALTGFINFLSKNFQHNLDIKAVPKAKLKRPNESKEVLRQRLVRMLRHPETIERNRQYFLRMLISYLHRIYVPVYAYIDLGEVKSNAANKRYIRLCGEDFYVPDMKKLYEIVTLLSNRKR